MQIYDYNFINPLNASVEGSTGISWVKYVTVVQMLSSKFCEFFGSNFFCETPADDYFCKHQFAIPIIKSLPLF